MMRVDDWLTFVVVVILEEEASALQRDIYIRIDIT